MMDFAIAHNPRLPFSLMTAGTGLIFGLDFSNPQTVETILGGGLAVIALFVLWRLSIGFFKSQNAGEKNEGDLLGLLRVVMTDVTDALKNNNQIMTELKEVIRQDRRETHETLTSFDHRIKVLEVRVGEVHDVLIPNPEPEAGTD